MDYQLCFIQHHTTIFEIHAMINSINAFNLDSNKCVDFEKLSQLVFYVPNYQ
jgi:hypothetical protein